MYWDITQDYQVSKMEMERSIREAERAWRFRHVLHREDQWLQDVAKRGLGFLRRVLRTERPVVDTALGHLSH